MVHAYNPSDSEAEVRLQVQGQPKQFSEALHNLAIPCLKPLKKRDGDIAQG